MGQSLSTDINASRPLQEFAQLAMEVIREIDNRSSASIQAIQHGVMLDLVQSTRADEVVHLLGRLARLRQMLGHVDQFLHQQAEELEASRAEHLSRRRGVGHPDLAKVVTNISWDVGPDRLRVGDLSRLDRATAVAIRDAAMLSRGDRPSPTTGRGPRRVGRWADCAG